MPCSGSRRLCQQFRRVREVVAGNGIGGRSTYGVVWLQNILVRNGVAGGSMLPRVLLLQITMSLHIYKLKCCLLITVKLPIVMTGEHH